MHHCITRFFDVKPPIFFWYHGNFPPTFGFLESPQWWSSTFQNLKPHAANNELNGEATLQITPRKVTAWRGRGASPSFSASGWMDDLVLSSLYHSEIPWLCWLFQPSGRTSLCFLLLWNLHCASSLSANLSSKTWYLFHRGQLGLHNNSVAPGLLFCYSPPAVHRRRSSYRPLRIVCTHGLPGQWILRSFAEFLCKETAKKLLFKKFQDSKCLQESTLGRTAPNAKRSLQVEPPSAVQRSHWSHSDPNPSDRSWHKYSCIIMHHHTSSIIYVIRHDHHHNNSNSNTLYYTIHHRSSSSSSQQKAALLVVEGSHIFGILHTMMHDRTNIIIGPPSRGSHRSHGRKDFVWRSRDIMRYLDTVGVNMIKIDTVTAPNITKSFLISAPSSFIFHCPWFHVISSVSGAKVFCSSHRPCAKGWRFNLGFFSTFLRLQYQ